MSPGEIDPTVIRRHLAVLLHCVEVLQGHTGRDVSLLRESFDGRIGWLDVTIGDIGGGQWLASASIRSSTASWEVQPIGSGRVSIAI